MKAGFNSDAARRSYERRIDRLDLEAIARVFVDHKWAYAGVVNGEVRCFTPQSADLRSCLDELFDSCLKELEKNHGEQTWCASGRFLVEVRGTDVSIDGQALIYREAPLNVRDARSPDSAEVGT